MEREELTRNIRRKAGLIRQIKTDIIIKTGAFVIAAVLVFTLLIGIDRVEGNDMFPAVRDGDIVLYIRPGRIGNTDVVIYETNEGKRIGRVAAAAGSGVDRNGAGLLLIDGKLQPVQERSGLYYETHAGPGLTYPSVVPEGALLLLGDMREHAEDSRKLGFISREHVKGKVMIVLRKDRI